MSILKKFFKNKKGPSEIPEEKPLKRDTVYVYNHMKAVLEDGRLYDTESAEKVFSEKAEFEIFCTNKQSLFFDTARKMVFS